MDGACPKCGEDVPLVLRGVAAHCAACGEVRPALGRKVLGVTGKPALFGGAAATILGGLVLAFGTLIALVVMGVIQLIWPEGNLGYAIGGPIELVTILMASAFFFGGRMLFRASDRAVDGARVEAVEGLARQRNGILRVEDVARALSIPQREADKLLTDLAKEPDRDIGVDFNEEGEVLFLFGSPDAKRFRLRVSDEALGQALDAIDAGEEVVFADEEREEGATVELPE